MYNRLLKKIIKQKLFKGKAIVITGARQTGKTTLALDLIRESRRAKSAVTFNCDNPSDRETLNNRDIEFLAQAIGPAKVVFIDEGQKVETIGQTLKLLVDRFKKQKQVIVTGSSSIHLLDRTQETLTGRKLVHTLYPLSLEEIYPGKDRLQIAKGLKELLIFGSYPEVVVTRTFKGKIDLLQELTSSCLYKDILEFQMVKNSNVLVSLVKALALQLGSEVSYSELANLIGIDKKTIEKYIDLLEKNHVIFRLPPYTSNKRRELSRLKKIYFYDIGVRNAVINNFNFLDSRNDAGALWENFMIVERLKYRAYHGLHANQYFWRTYDGSEVDLVEERGGRADGYEFKWSLKKKKTKPPAKWLEYPNSSFRKISPNDIFNFII
jgi:uncharacterized protein